jgi:CRISPR-associated protein (Cas_Cmr5).
MYAQKTIKELQSMADEIKEQAKKYDYTGTAKKAGSAVKNGLVNTLAFGMQVFDEAKEKAKSE